MIVEPALESCGPANPEESAIRLISLTDVWPPLDHEPAAVTEPARPGYVPPVASDPASALPRQFAVFLVEGLAGVRPVRQLLPWMSKRGTIHLHRLMPLFKNGQRPRVRRVLVTRPAADVIEMTLIVVTGSRTRALAVRLERTEPARVNQSSRWLCTDIEAALSRLRSRRNLTCGSGVTYSLPGVTIRTYEHQLIW
jgi:mRNA-degrading endonuclease toxin of MazEF toxin-antitoxin module